VIKDPPFTKLDFLSCRNMLIYMEPDLQKKIIDLFTYCLNPGATLFLGIAESPGIGNSCFHYLDGKQKIYKRSSAPIPSEFIDFPSSYSKRVGQSEPKKPLKAVENIQTLADQILLQRFAPASVLVNNKGDIIYITGRIGKYLEPVAGKANWNIFAMAKDGVSQALPAGFRKAMQNFETVVVHNVRIGANGTKQVIDITVQCIESPDSIRGMIMVIFTDIPGSAPSGKNNLKNRNLSPSGKEKELESELQQCYEELQKTREEMQSSQEELKSINEELQSTNEELQSTNEELTTSKEEMQSLNEELQTVNAELQNRVNEFVRANDDMKNLLNNTEIATLFLDRELNIRRFTSHVSKIIKLRDTDIGRPFMELVTDLNYPKMALHSRQVIKTLSSVETSIATNDGRWFKVRIMPYCTVDDHIDGLVITFTDITVAKKLELKLREANETLRKLKKPHG
jgi:two-component system CheB/CheR fusion protein